VSTTTSSTSSDQPQQTGTAANCNKFYLVQPGDSCTAIESEFGISLSQFIAWNPAVNTGMSHSMFSLTVLVNTRKKSKTKSH
jgi:LysM repeat protein